MPSVLARSTRACIAHGQPLMGLDYPARSFPGGPPSCSIGSFYRLRCGRAREKCTPLSEFLESAPATVRGRLTARLAEGGAPPAAEIPSANRGSTENVFQAEATTGADRTTWTTQARPDPTVSDGRHRDVATASQQVVRHWRSTENGHLHAPFLRQEFLETQPARRGWEGEVATRSSPGTYILRCQKTLDMPWPQGHDGLRRLGRCALHNGGESWRISSGFRRSAVAARPFPC
jgi:hypothetical protein